MGSILLILSMVVILSSPFSPRQVNAEDESETAKIIELDSINNRYFGDLHWGESQRVIFPKRKVEMRENRIQELDYDASLHFHVSPESKDADAFDFIWNSKSMTLLFCSGRFFAADIWFAREWTHLYLRKYLVKRFGIPQEKNIMADGFNEVWRDRRLEINLQNWEGYTILKIKHRGFERGCNQLKNAREKGSHLGFKEDNKISMQVANKVSLTIGVKDLLGAPVDVIVNPANAGLSHGGGLAAIISDEAGPKLDERCRQIIRKIGKIPITKAVPTRAYQLPFKGIIHAVGPRMGKSNGVAS